VNRQWIVGIVASLGALAVGAGVAWAGSDDGIRVADGVPVMAICVAFAYTVQWIMFVHASLARTERYFDLTGSLTYVAMIVGAVWLSGAYDARSLVLAGAILIWAFRLGPFLYSRVKRAGEDRRFRTIKTSFPTFFMTWTLQGTWVFITASCALAAITARAPVPSDAALWIGLAVWLLGFVVEVVADRQKSAFRADPANAGRFIADGLWAWSRHPNYFGEIVLWLGIAVIAYPALAGWQVLTLISPLFVLVLLTTISGVPLLEARADKVWGSEPAYQAYKRNTPVLLLRPPKVGQPDVE
jgi:steroid 5-alpha reductase family enzyme